MTSLVIQPTQIAQWHALVNEAQANLALDLGEELESYLVFLLMRFIEKPEMVRSILALEFLKGLDADGRVRNEILREVGDKCLIFSGLFPGLAKRRRLRNSYFVDLGQNAYYALAGLSQMDVAKLYHLLSEHFEPMRDVLRAMRNQEHFVSIGEADGHYHKTDSYYHNEYHNEGCNKGGYTMEDVVNDIKILTNRVIH